MMKKLLILLMLTAGTTPLWAERYIEFVDVDGIRHRYELADGDTENHSVRVVRPDESVELFVDYEGGAFDAAVVLRPDETPEAGIFYGDGMLEAVGTYRSDESTEAIIRYEGGRINALSIADPDQEDAEDGKFIVERGITFRNGYPACE